MMAAHARVAVKRVYEASTDSDGTRILVDRLWPRGLTKVKARVDRWLRELAPSNELRQWFHAHPEERAEFRKRYLGELKSPSAGKALEQLQELLCTSSRVTLLFASKNAESNNATVLKEFLEGKKSLKPRKAAPGRQRIIARSRK
jgi:uncharacterized protein YeaO (DUF488 family)